MKKLGLYIHIPFCQSKCYYCDFKSFPNRLEIVNKYIQYFKKEIDLYSNDIKKYSIDTVFIGGGTPTLIDSKYIYDIFNHLSKRTDMSNLTEVTIESNPKTVDDNKLKLYKDIGINRISMGVQSLNDSLLKKIGRIHSRKDFFETYNLIRKWGFNNVNLDIMFNLPKQTINDVIQTLKEVIELDVEHISFYSLKLEEGTPFYRDYQKSLLVLPDEDEEREMYHRGIELLEKKYYNHYEISNFSRFGYQCKHNLKYWKIKPYLGLGLASHSNMNGIRFSNYYDFEGYFSKLDENKLPIMNEEVIDIEMERAEYLILGLRLIEGINKNEFKVRYGIDIMDIYENQINKLLNVGLLFIDRDCIKLTKLGLDVSNIVFREFLP